MANLRSHSNQSIKYESGLGLQAGDISSSVDPIHQIITKKKEGVSRHIWY
jgi:hypothetical protein